MMILPDNYCKTLGAYGIESVPFSRLRGNADSELFLKSIEVTPEMLKTNLMQRFIRGVVRVFAPML